MAPRSRIRGRQTCDCICGAAHVVFIVVVVEQAAPTVGKQRVGGGELLGRLLPGAVQGRAAQGSTEHVSELVVGDCGRAGSAGGGARWAARARGRAGAGAGGPGRRVSRGRARAGRPRHRGRPGRARRQRRPAAPARDGPHPAAPGLLRWRRVLGEALGLGAGVLSRPAWGSACRRQGERRLCTCRGGNVRCTRAARGARRLQGATLRGPWKRLRRWGVTAMGAILGVAWQCRKRQDARHHRHQWGALSVATTAKKVKDKNSPEAKEDSLKRGRDRKAEHGQQNKEPQDKNGGKGALL